MRTVQAKVFIARFRDWIKRYRWWFEDIGWPWLLTRIALLIIGLFASSIPPEEIMPERGWYYSPHRLVDIWGRWDTGWYMSIATQGYTSQSNIYGQRNTAFGPLYPYAVKLAHDLLVPSSLRTNGTLLFVGMVSSNLAFLGALTLLYRLFLEKWGGRAEARYLIFYLCIFPTSFIFSSFYTESFYLLFTLLAFYAAERDHWWLAGLGGGLCALTRLVGVLAFISLILLYWQREKTIRWKVLWMGLIPAATFLWAFLTYRITGDPLELFHVRAGWEQSANWPWLSLAADGPAYIVWVDRTAIVLFTVLAFLTFRFGLAYGTWALFHTLFVLTTRGSTVSITRYVSIVFPVFVLLSLWGRRHAWVHQAVVVLSLAFLALLAALWSQFYWSV